MPQDNQNSIPVVEFDPRSGKPLFSPEYYERTAEQYKDYDAKGEPKQQTENSYKGSIRRGMWLKGKLETLQNDPKYKAGTPEQQREWKSLAYDKWVQPYYKNVLKVDPPVKEEWLTGQYSKTGFVQRSHEYGEKLDREILGHTLKATTDITAGLLHNVADAVEAIDKMKIFGGETSQGQQRAQQIRKIGDKYTEYGKQADQYLESIHNRSHGEKPKFREDIPGKISELGTQAIFFEATGGAKIAKVLNVANPKTAALAFQMAKASWNGAVDYGMWSASQGDKPEEVVQNFGTGGVLGPIAKLGQRKILGPLLETFKTLFKWGGKEAVEQVLSESVEEASDRVHSIKEGNYRPSGWIHDIESPHSSVFDPDFGIKSSVRTVAKSSTLTPEGQRLVGATVQQLDMFAQAKFKKNYADLPYIQKINILNKALSTVSEAAQSAKSEGMPKQLIQAQAKEEDELMASIFPEAKVSQQKIDKFIVENGEAPVATKFLASLPHHNTTVESPWKHLQARVSFLKNQLRTAKGEEKQSIQQALDDEYSLMKQKKQKAKGTVGGAAASDPTVFKGEQYTITPNVDPYNHGFTDWYSDSFAKGVARAAKEQALVKGQKQSYLASAIDNSFLLGSNLAKATRTADGITKQLYHSQFGLVGGINYSIQANELYINHLAMRPNVVARVWSVPGGGQALFLNAVQEASQRNIGIRLIPFDESKSFYKKLGMKEDPENKSYMVMSKEEVKDLLAKKGLLMMLLGAGIIYGANKDLSQGDYSVKESN